MYGSGIGKSLPTTSNLFVLERQATVLLKINKIQQKANNKNINVSKELHLPGSRQHDNALPKHAINIFASLVYICRYEID